jgi:hypothetical protein
MIILHLYRFRRCDDCWILLHELERLLSGDSLEYWGYIDLGSDCYRLRSFTIHLPLYNVPHHSRATSSTIPLSFFSRIYSKCK